MIKSIFDLLLLFSKITVDKKNTEEIYTFFFVGLELFSNTCSSIKFTVSSIVGHTNMYTNHIIIFS